MTLYQILIVLHVIAAVGGLGQTSVLGVMARNPSLANLPLMHRIFKAVGGSLVVMLVTGLAMLWITDWVYEHTWWFRIAFVLFIALGALHGIGQSRLKKLIASRSQDATALKSLTVIMSVLLAIIVFLMEGKPF